MPLILPYNNKYPTISSSAFIAENAVIIGDVTIGDESSIWYGCVLRGDVEKIIIGNRTNIQDNTTIHVNRNNGPTIIGDGVTVGHMVMLHACIIESHTLIGMHSTILDFAHISHESMVAAGALISPKKIVQTQELWAGVPGKFLRHMTIEETKYLKISEENYVHLSREYIEVCIG